MAVTFDSSAKNIQTSTVVGVCTFTIAANACLVVGVGTTTNVSISACAVNGTQMTQLGRVANDADGTCVTLYGLTAAPSGVVSISANMVGGGAATLFVGGCSYTGMTPTNTFGTVNTGTAGAVATFALSMSTSTTDVAFMFAGGFSLFTATNSTTRVTDSAHRAFRMCDTAGPASAISLSASCVTTSQNLAFLGVNIAMNDPSPATGGNFLCLLGVGT